MPSKDFWERVLSQSSRQASHVAHSVDMLGALPGAMERADNSYLQIACLESFLVHVRLLIEFLLIHRANPVKDFSARDFGWDGPPAADWSHLETVWVIASRHVVHFSADRAPQSVHDVKEVDTSVAGLCAIAADVVACQPDGATGLP
jgi:hypothetical protein